MTITLESPLRLRKRLRATFSPATTARQLNKLKDEAKQSLLELEYLYLIKTPPLQLVAFYAAVSPWCDRNAELYQLERKLARIDYGQYTEARKALVALAAQEERDLYGVNQTSVGETPTMNTTFLGGDRCGLPTKSVTYWENTRNVLGKQPALLGVANSPTIAQVIDDRASKPLNNGLVRWKSLLQALIYS
jgi:hypothetical protein